jgi:hypothetical protein
MEESDKHNDSKIKFRYVAIAIVFIGCVSVITSYITVKTLVPALPKFTPTPFEIIKTNTPTISPTSTLYIFPTVTQTPLPTTEPNLLQNGDFENGLAGWTYTDNSKEGITIFETIGVTGKSYCSRRYLLGNQIDLLKKEQVGFSQEVPIDLTQSYFFSAKIKMYEGYNIFAEVRYYYDSKVSFGEFLNTKASENEGTTNGWYLLQKTISAKIPGLPTANRAIVGFWHIPTNRQIVGIIDSTFCIDDVVFRKQ